MKKVINIVLSFAVILLVLSCNGSNKKEIDQISVDKKVTQKKNTKSKEMKFKYSTEELKEMFPKIEEFQFVSEDMKNIRKRDFSVNMYEVNYSTMLMEKGSEGNSQTLNIKILDIGDNMLYPPLLAHNVFYKFGMKTDSELIFKDKENYGDWNLVYNYDKIKGTGNTSALNENLFIIMNSANIDIEQIKEIIKEDILQKIDNK